MGKTRAGRNVVECDHRIEFLVYLSVEGAADDLIGRVVGGFALAGHALDPRLGIRGEIHWHGHARREVIKRPILQSVPWSDQRDQAE